MSPPVIFVVMAILCFLVACGVTIKGIAGMEAVGATKWFQVAGAGASALMFGALAVYTWVPPSKAAPDIEQLPTSQPAISSASPEPLTKPQEPHQAPTEALTLTPAGSWFAGVKYMDDLQLPDYAFTYHLVFDAAGELQRLLSWWTDGIEGRNATHRPIRSGQLAGNRLSLAYDSPNGSAITLDAKLLEKQGQVYLFDTTLAVVKADPNLAPSERKVPVQAALYLEHED